MDYITEQLLLKPLGPEHSGAYGHLYCTLYTAAVFLPGETAAAFTRRIMDACTCIYALYVRQQPQLLIGDCALHHWDETTGTIEIGGALLPGYQGKGLMLQAFECLIGIAQSQYNVRHIIARTGSDNIAAIKLAVHLGFQIQTADENETVLVKHTGTP